MTFPKQIFVRVDQDNDSILIADYTQEAAMDNDGPMTLGVYALVGTQRVEKIVSVHEVKKRKTR